MDDTLNRPDDLIEQLERMVVRTPNGSYVKLDDLKELVRKRQEAQQIQEAEQPYRLTVVQARARAREFLKEQGPERPPSLGRAITAQPVSRP